MDSIKKRFSGTLILTKLSSQLSSILQPQVRNLPDPHITQLQLPAKMISLALTLDKPRPRLLSLTFTILQKSKLLTLQTRFARRHLHQTRPNQNQQNNLHDYRTLLKHHYTHHHPHLTISNISPLMNLLLSTSLLLSLYYLYKNGEKNTIFRIQTIHQSAHTHNLNSGRPVGGI